MTERSRAQNLVWMSATGQSSSARYRCVSGHCHHWQMCIYIGRRRQIYRAASIRIVQSIVAILTVMARVIQAKPMIAIGCVI